MKIKDIISQGFMGSSYRNLYKLIIIFVINRRAQHHQTQQVDNWHLRVAHLYRIHDLPQIHCLRFQRGLIHYDRQPAQGL